MQLPLFDGEDHKTPPRIQAAARRVDPETSHEAARKIESCGDAEQHRRIVAEAVCRVPGCTAAELPDHCELVYSQIHKRLKEVEEQGIIERGPRRLCTKHERSRMLTWWKKGEVPA